MFSSLKGSIPGMLRPRTLAAALLATATVALAGCLGDGDGEERAATAPATGPPADVEATADVGASPAPPPSLSGLLHGVAGAAPPDTAVLPLRPRVWRSVPSRVPYARAAAAGARYQLVLSDLWGYPPTGWEGRGPPWRDLGAWERLVRRTARSLRGRDVEWDVWNEPDNETFWTGTREQFFAVYATAARALVDELGERAVVGGPSTTKARPAWLEGLLEHCRRRGCRVGFLSFHANLAADEPIPPLAARVRAVRALIPRYRDLSLTRVQVNESVGPTDQYRPGEILGYLHHMEAGGADAAVRSCWPALGRLGQLLERHARRSAHPGRRAAERVVGLPPLCRGRGHARARHVLIRGGGRAREPPDGRGRCPGAARPQRPRRRGRRRRCRSSSRSPG